MPASPPIELLSPFWNELSRKDDSRCQTEHNFESRWNLQSFWSESSSYSSIAVEERNRALVESLLGEVVVDLEADGLEDAGRRADRFDENDSQAAVRVLDGEQRRNVSASALAHAHDLGYLEVVDDAHELVGDILESRILSNVEVGRLKLLSGQVHVQPDDAILYLTHLCAVHEVLKLCICRCV